MSIFGLVARLPRCDFIFLVFVANDNSAPIVSKFLYNNCGLIYLRQKFLKGFIIVRLFQKKYALPNLIKSRKI